MVLAGSHSGNPVMTRTVPRLLLRPGHRRPARTRNDRDPAAHLAGDLPGAHLPVPRPAGAGTDARRVSRLRPAGPVRGPDHLPGAGWWRSLDGVPGDAAAGAHRSR